MWEKSDWPVHGVFVVITDSYSTECTALIFHSIYEWIYVFYFIVCRLKLGLSGDLDLDATGEFKWKNII